MSERSRFIFIFLDGVGIGRADQQNPFYSAGDGANYMPFFKGGCILPDKTPIKPIDACLGVNGIPMSATGQTSLFTGENIPAILNCHKDSYPDNFMRRVIKRSNIFTRLKRNAQKVRFLNVYPDNAHLFTPGNIRIQDDGRLLFSEIFPTGYRGMISVTSCMMLASGLIPFSKDDILNEKALYHDFSNRSLIERGVELPEFSPEKAAEIIYRTALDYDFLLYEFFQSDMFGHGYPFEDCVQLVLDLNRLIKKLISLLDIERDTLLITSDHGNLEDFTTQLHTSHPVPLLAWGKYHEFLFKKIDSLVDVTPTIVEIFSPTNI